MKKIIKVFPRRTSMTPEDGRVGLPEFWDEADEVHISVTWVQDKPIAEQWAKEWERVAPVKIGGPAYDDCGGDFEPGKYVKLGCVITSRGCPNHCWFCSAWKREGRQIRELPIHCGYNLLDSNILACSDTHIRSVFTMLGDAKRRFRHGVEFSGGLEAKRLKSWHVDAITKLRPAQLFFAYDTPDDLEPLRYAAKLFHERGWSQTTHRLRCYVLVGWKGDTQEKAWIRMKQAQNAGFFPMGMLYQDNQGRTQPGWKAKPFADIHCVAKTLKTLNIACRC